MRRRDFTTGLLLAAATRTAQAQERARQHRIAILEATFAASISDPGSLLWHPFWEQLRRRGDVEGQNLAVDRYSVEGRPEGDVDLAREVVGRNPDVIVAVTDHNARAVHSANGTIPIVWIGGDPIEAGFAASLARPGGKITGVDVYARNEIWGKLLQIVKEAVPSAAKVAFLAMAGPLGNQLQVLQEACRQLRLSLLLMQVTESTPSEYQRVFAEITQARADAIIVHARGELLRSRQLIVELVEKNRLPAIYPWREYVEAGGLMAYASDFRELGRRMADDVHEILNGADPGDIPIYLPTKYEFLINLRAAKALGITLPPMLLATADEVIE
jgi:putative tryptophan/tyrosine transport system substrate-binding protein